MFAMKLDTFTSAAFLLLTSAVLSSASAQLVVLGRGRCPNVPTQASFDSSRYLGMWYEFERFDNWFEVGVKCGSADYGANADQSISVLNGGVRSLEIFGRTIFQAPTSITGKATTPDASRPAELRVSFSDFDRVGGNDPNYFIVETDYDSYAVVFSCSKIPGLPVNIQFAWILTRARGAAPANLAQIKSNLESAGVKTRNFKPVDQSECQA